MRNKTLKQLPAMTGAEKVFCFHGDEENVNGRTWKGTAFRKHAHHDLKLSQHEGYFELLKAKI